MRLHTVFIGCRCTGLHLEEAPGLSHALRTTSSAHKTSGEWSLVQCLFIFPTWCLLRPFFTLLLGCLSSRNGRWRSEWDMTFSPGGSGELKGILRVQVCVCVWVAYHFTHCTCTWHTVITMDMPMGDELKWLLKEGGWHIFKSSWKYIHLTWVSLSLFMYACSDSAQYASFVTSLLCNNSKWYLP